MSTNDARAAVAAAQSALLRAANACEAAQLSPDVIGPLDDALVLVLRVLESIDGEAK